MHIISLTYDDPPPPPQGPCLVRPAVLRILASLPRVNQPHWQPPTTEHGRSRASSAPRRRRTVCKISRSLCSARAGWRAGWLAGLELSKCFFGRHTLAAHVCTGIDWHSIRKISIGKVIIDKEESRAVNPSPPGRASSLASPDLCRLRNVFKSF